ncbi:hypothetical protein H4R18_001732 [Coemansia javaensis]|uniref:Uncharacterized protein n=1 Tax=Coemansia javaensis TaxID=2761396 RepID=A0A9W8HCU3_9FUNG|nr:hypothetical protein H4R18_001732 [Coemansia javaensis]
MASSITLAGGRSAVVYPRTISSRLAGARQPQQWPAEADQNLRRLVQDMAASMLVEEEEEEEDEHGVGTAQRRLDAPAAAPGMSPPPPPPESRRKRAVRSTRDRVARIARVIAYYIRRFLSEYASSTSIYRPLRLGMY